MPNTIVVANLSDVHTLGLSILIMADIALYTAFIVWLNSKYDNILIPISGFFVPLVIAGLVLLNY